MVMAIFILIGSSILAWMVTRPLIKKKEKKEGIVVLILFLISALISCLTILEIKVPNPSDFLVFILQPISKWVDFIFR
ncbi:hypothetical protein ACE38V_08960 [Cytobacillus sp. Hz8]|uniref:hypothetical protein n=1 Tax=Cytobacillus sp. Hz8 TaxID=3347168 RepID=UPI0035D8B81B